MFKVKVHILVLFSFIEYNSMQVFKIFVLIHNPGNNYRLGDDMNLTREREPC